MPYLRRQFQDLYPLNRLRVSEQMPTRKKINELVRMDRVRLCARLKSDDQRAGHHVDRLWNASDARKLSVRIGTVPLNPKPVVGLVPGPDGIQVERAESVNVSVLRLIQLRSHLFDMAGNAVY